MIAAPEFCQALLEQGYDYFTGVPCSFFQGVFSYAAENSKKLNYVIAANEGSAVGLAAGAYFAGRRPVVMIQNSGLGNMVNPLTSLSSIYKVPTLLLISGRAYGVDDEPQHEIMGRSMKDLLKAMEIPTFDAPQDLPNFKSCVRELTTAMFEKNIPHALIIKKGTITEGSVSCASATEDYPLTRQDAIRVVNDFLDDKTAVVSTTGMASREFFAMNDRHRNLYLMGSLGHAMAVGCSLATEKPDLKVVVLDGDGSVIMHMGTLSTIGFYKPANFIQVILDNETYETTGNQDTTSKTTHFSEIARSCGIAKSVFAKDETGLRTALKTAFSEPGPHVIHIKVNQKPAGKLPRITTKLSASQIGSRFFSAVHQK